MATGYIKTTLGDDSLSSPPENQTGRYRVGQILLGRYEIFALDPRGSFAIVYMVNDLKTDKQYAVKTPKAEFVPHMPKVDAFKEEIAFWIKIPPHPNVLTAYFVEVIDEQPYLFMEYVAGPEPTLRHRLRRGALPLEQLLFYAYQFCLGMEHANRGGEIAHFDLKPENLLITPEDVLKVTDFGLAQRVQVLREQIPRLSAGSWLYAPPERVERFATVESNRHSYQGVVAEDSRSDIFSFGIILYEMATGRLPFPFALTDSSAANIRVQLANFYVGQREHRRDFPPDSPLPASLIATCLDLYTEERFRNFSHLREHLEKLYGFQPPTYHQSGQAASHAGQKVRRGGREAEGVLIQGALARLTAKHQKWEQERQVAQNLVKLGRYSEGLVLFNKLLRMRPEDLSLAIEAAEAMWANNQLAGAIVLLAYFLGEAPASSPHLDAAKSLLHEMEQATNSL